MKKYKGTIQKIRKTIRKINLYIHNNPIKSFYISLAILFALILLGNALRALSKESLTIQKQKINNVSVYFVNNKIASINTYARVEKTGIAQINALSSGIVQKINYKQGDRVKKGSIIFTLSSNYQGGNTFSVQRKIAQTQYQNILTNYDDQKNAISLQREIAQKTNENVNSLRDLIPKSIDETKDLILLNESILSTINTNLKVLENDPITNQTLILSTKQLKSQYTSVNNQLKSGLRQSEYQADPESPQSDLSDLQKSLLETQLNMQEKALDINRDLARLQVQLAQTTESIMFPSAPFSGIIQKVFIKKDQQVNPGTPLALISQENKNINSTAYAYIAKDIAQKISKKKPSLITINKKKIKVIPDFISTEAVLGDLYSVLFVIPKGLEVNLTDNTTIPLQITLENSDNTTFIPVDLLHQTTDGVYIYIIKNNKAKSEKIEIEKIIGSQALVKKVTAKAIIIDRNIIDGDVVKIKQ